VKKILVIIIFLIFITGCDNKEDRYEEIIKDFEEGLLWHLNASYPNCQEGSSGIITSSFLISNGYIKKEILLDVDKESYCKVNAKRACVNGENTYKIYLKCKDYVSDGYVDW